MHFGHKEKRNKENRSDFTLTHSFDNLDNKIPEFIHRATFLKGY